MWTTAPVQQLIASLEGFAPGLSPSLDTSSVAYGSALQVARSLISKLNTSPAALQSLGVARCITLIFKLQNLAYADHDSGGQHDIALWCERHWATIIHCDPQNLSALQGE